MLARDQATLARAQADLQRARDLLQKHVAAQQQVDQAEADAKIAAANLQADQAALDDDRIRLDYTHGTGTDRRPGRCRRVTPGNIVRCVRRWRGPGDDHPDEAAAGQLHLAGA